MAKLILSMDGMVLKEVPLTKERTTVGRKSHNDIQIDNLAISGEHAVIVTILNDSFLEDLGSTNGTFINGHPIKKHFLQNGDLIELGKYRLKYLNEVPAQVAAEFEKTQVLRPDEGRQAPQLASDAPGNAAGDLPKLAPAAAANPPPPALDAAQAPAAPLPPAVIQILNGGNAGKELELTKTLTTLGRPGVQVAVIARRPHGYFITHVEGANFPVVNGRTLDAQACPLKEHDVVELAGVKMAFYFRG